MTPEFEFSLPPNSIYRSNIDTVGHCIGALDNLPGAALAQGDRAGFFRNPADGRRIEKNLRSTQRSQASCLGKPLVPANQGTDLRVPRLKTREPQITWSEIEFFIVKRVIRDMH